MMMSHGSFQPRPDGRCDGCRIQLTTLFGRAHMPPSNSDSQPSLRPTMRRKSSAQNLLSSFKAAATGSSSSANANINGNNTNNSHGGTNNNGSAGTGNGSGNGNGAVSVSVAAVAASGMNGVAHPLSPPTVLAPSPLPPPPSSTSSSAIPTPSTSGTSTPALPPFAILHAQQQPQQQPQAQQPGAITTAGAAAVAATPTVRDWDAQSMHADSATAGQFFPPVGAGVVGTGGAGSSGSPGATVEYLRDLVQKRIITLTYTRNVHDGYVLSFTSIFFSLSPPSFSDLASCPSSQHPTFSMAALDERIGSIRS